MVGSPLRLFDLPVRVHVGGRRRDIEVKVRVGRADPGDNGAVCTESRLLALLLVGGAALARTGVAIADDFGVEVCADNTVSAVEATGKPLDSARLDLMVAAVQRICDAESGKTAVRSKALTCGIPRRMLLINQIIDQVKD
ncbi:hypothetical protein [Luethyella okanaganae]|uniref:Uncharacterized protein n=1 Tax=Luethyella okanaganae TaxID=69372 RepID=A0ABW1VG53_9MICO